MKTEWTPEQKYTADTMLLTLRENIAEAESKLAQSVLVGQGYICVISDGTMALTIDGGRYRLQPVRGSLVGVTHWTAEDAAKIATHWNAGLGAACSDQGHGGQEDRLRVAPTHYRDALKNAVKNWQDLILMWSAEVEG